MLCASAFLLSSKNQPLTRRGALRAPAQDAEGKRAALGRIRIRHDEIQTFALAFPIAARTMRPTEPVFARRECGADVLPPGARRAPLRRGVLF